MNDEQMDDLKQFISSTVSQTEQRLGERMDGVEQRLDRMQTEMEQGFAGVGEAIDAIHERMDEYEKQTDTRLTKLEQKAA